MPVFLVRGDAGVETVILPIHGYGLWSTMYAYVALDGRGERVKGVTFYAHAETPGLGAEIENARWRDSWVGKRLIGDDSQVDKEYLVRVEGRLDERGLALLNHGLELDGRKLRPAQVSWQNEDQLKFILREGRKRQIRRMCELVGLKVVGLKRVRIGGVSLGPLPLGQWRVLLGSENF